jgi:hypothetical protein
MNRYWGICCAFLCGLASAKGTIAGWDFASAATGPLANYAASTTDPRVTSATLSTSGGAITPNVSAGGAHATALNYHWTGGGAGGGGLNGAIIELQIATAGATFSGFTALYTVASGDVSAITGTWTYWINNGTHNTLSPETIAIGATATPNSDILTGISLANNDVLHLQFALGAPTVGNGAGDFDIDSLIISASSITPVPEPVNVALGIFAVTAIGVTAVRRFLTRRP